MIWRFTSSVFKYRKRFWSRMLSIPVTWFIRVHIFICERFLIKLLTKKENLTLLHTPIRATVEAGVGKKGKGYRHGSVLSSIPGGPRLWETVGAGGTWPYLLAPARAGRRSWRPRRERCWCTGGTGRSPSAWSPLAPTSGRWTFFGHLCHWKEIRCKINFAAVCRFWSTQVTVMAKG